MNWMYDVLIEQQEMELLEQSECNRGVAVEDVEFDYRAGGTPIFVLNWCYTLDDTPYTDNNQAVEVIHALPFPRDVGKMIVIPKEVFRVQVDVDLYRSASALTPVFSIIGTKA